MRVAVREQKSNLKLCLPIRRRRPAGFEQWRYRTEIGCASAGPAHIEPRQALARAVAVEAPFTHCDNGGARAVPGQFASIDSELIDHFRQAARLPLDVPLRAAIH
jgi:hypothetical protein